MKLYELAEQYNYLLEAIECGDIPEEAINDTLEAVGGEFDIKCDNIACAIKNMLAEAEMIKAEEAKLKERRAKKERSADRLTEYLSRAMQATNKTKLETARNQITFRKSRAVQILDENGFIEWARENAPEALKVTEKPVIATVRDIMKNGNVPFVVVEERQNIQIN